MKTIKILIIDKSINRDLFKLDYLDLDYEISGQVNNYKDALEIINNSSPDFILIDINNQNI